MDTLNFYLLKGWILKYINYTHLVLIPKSPQGESFTNYRLISSYIVIIFFLKVKEHRLKMLLKHIISLDKIVFVVRRWILNYMFSSHKKLHSMKHSIFLGMVIKLDIAKVYDHVN